jgi:hypothetical protein
MFCVMTSQTRVGLGVVGLSFIVYWLSNRTFDTGRGDFFYLADAFLHGQTWLPFQPGPWDFIEVHGRFYVPFAPFPAIAFAPLVAVFGAATADEWQSVINAVLAALDVGLCWLMLGRFGVSQTIDRFWTTVLFAFSTAIWWVTVRGGVWHTGHLIAMALTFGCLIEVSAARPRPWLIGLLAGCAFLTRPPLAFAVPFYLMIVGIRSGSGGVAVRGDHIRRVLGRSPVRAYAELLLPVLPSVAFFFLYNVARFNDPLESGYALATVPAFLERQRQIGLFSIAHIAMNLDYLLLHLPDPISDPPFFRPDGFGLSVLITSPGLLLAAMAPWRSRTAVILLGAALAVLCPSLLYYGGGWIQYGYRYFLDSVPFVIALCGMALALRPGITWGWKLIIGFGVLVNGLGVYWAYRI